MTSAPIRVAVICDFVEESWPSMNFVAESIIESLSSGEHGFVPVQIRPPMTRRFSAADQGRGYTADRLVNRFFDYPRHARRIVGQAELFHVVDHSYAQLVHQLPAAKTIVTCHDADTFRCLLRPEDEPRSPLFRMMVRRTLSGLRKAARVCCVSRVTRDTLLDAGLVSERRLRVIPNAIHPLFSDAPEPVGDARAVALLGEQSSHQTDLLYVGSNIPRKRLDLLLQVVAAVRRERPDVRLVKVGGPFTAAQQQLVHQLHLARHVCVLPNLDRRELAAVYRRAAVALLTSEREGFGLPLAEASACGTAVVATDLPVLREVGGNAVVYCRLGDIDAWVGTIIGLIAGREARSLEWLECRDRSVARGRLFAYASYSRQLADVYRELLDERAA